MECLTHIVKVKHTPFSKNIHSYWGALRPIEGTRTVYYKMEDVLNYLTP